MCCAVAAKSSYRHASKIPHSLRQIGLSYRGFGKLWSAFGSFQPFITNDTVEPPTETLISRGNSTRLSVNYVKLKRASLSGRSYAVGRFSKDRKRVVKGRGVSVRVVFGGGRIDKKKTRELLK